MKNSPCQNCPYRKATCHDYCREYLDWHSERVAFDKARKFDKLMGLIADQIIYRNSVDRRDRR